MEKVFQLEQREIMQAQQLDQERTQALAMYGALSMDIERARKMVENVVEKQNAFVRAALMARAVDRYENARLQGTALIYNAPEESKMELAPEPPPMKVNGALQPDLKAA